MGSSDSPPDTGAPTRSKGSAGKCSTPPNPERDPATAELDELVGEFLLESHEGLDRMDQDLLVLEREPNSPDAIARIFRTMHTIKGTCGFLGFFKTEAVAHAAESLLAGLRDGEFPVTPEIVTALLSAGDAIRQILAEIRATGSEGPSEHREVAEALDRLGGSRRRLPARAALPFVPRLLRCRRPTPRPIQTKATTPRSRGETVTLQQNQPSASTWVCSTD